MKTRVLALEKAACLNVHTPSSLQRSDAGDFAGGATATAVITVPPVCPSFQSVPARQLTAVPKISAVECAVARQTIEAGPSSPSAVVQEDSSATPFVKRPEGPEAVTKRLEASTVTLSTLALGMGASNPPHLQAASRRSPPPECANSLSYPQAKRSGTSPERAATRHTFEAGAVVQDVSARGQGPEVMPAQSPITAALIRRPPLSAHVSATATPRTGRSFDALTIPLTQYRQLGTRNTSKPREGLQA